MSFTFPVTPARNLLTPHPILLASPTNPAHTRAMTPYGHGNRITEIIGTLLRSDRTIPEIAEEFGLTFAAMLKLLESPLAQAELAALEKLSALRERIRIPLQRDTALHRLTHIAAFSLSENESRRAATTLIRASNPVPPTRLRVGAPVPTHATSPTPEPPPLQTSSPTPPTPKSREGSAPLTPQAPRLTPSPTLHAPSLTPSLPPPPAPSLSPPATRFPCPQTSPAPSAAAASPQALTPRTQARSVARAAAG